MTIKFWHEKTLNYTQWLAPAIDKRIVIDRVTNTGCWYVGHRYYTGMTFCIVEHEGKYAVGWAKCSPKDHFNKKIARAISLGRAKQALEQELLVLPSITKIMPLEKLKQYTDKLSLPSVL